MKRNLNAICRLMALVLSAETLPFSALAAAGSARKLIVVAARGSGADPELDAFAETLRRELSDEFAVIPAEVTERLRQTGGGEKVALEGMFAEADRILDGYYAYHADESATVRNLEKLLGDVSEATPTRESSRLAANLRTTLAWLTYRMKRREESVLHLRAAFPGGAKPADISDYPSSFRQFARRAIADEKGGSARIESVPAVGDVFVDGVFAGVTPFQTRLAAGTHDIAVTAEGRLPHRETFVIGEGDILSLKTRLVWDRKRREGKELPAGSDVTGKADATLAVSAARLCRIAQSDVAVFVAFTGRGKGRRSVVRAFDASRAQFFKSVVAAKDDGAAVTRRFTRVLASQLGGEATYWSRGVDRDTVTDTHVASRKGRPFYRHPAFWAAVGAVVAGGIVAGVLASGGGSSVPATGSVVVDF